MGGRSLIRVFIDSYEVAAVLSIADMLTNAGVVWSLDYRFAGRIDVKLKRGSSMLDL